LVKISLKITFLSNSVNTFTEFYAKQEELLKLTQVAGYDFSPQGAEFSQRTRREMTKSLRFPARSLRLRR